MYLVGPPHGWSTTWSGTLYSVLYHKAFNGIVSFLGDMTEKLNNAGFYYSWKSLFDDIYSEHHSSAAQLQGIIFSFSFLASSMSQWQLQAVSRTLQVRQREPSVKILRSPLSVEFRKHCVLSGRTQRRACRRHQSGIINSSKYFISSSGDRTHNQSVLQSHFEPLRHDWPQDYVTHAYKWLHIESISKNYIIYLNKYLFVVQTKYLHARSYKTLSYNFWGSSYSGT